MSLRTLLASSVVIATAVHAPVLHATPLSRTVRIEGRDHVVVTTSRIMLGDLADIRSTRMSDDEAVIALRKIGLDASPAPARRTEIPAERVIEAMRRAGVNFESVSYRFPRVMVVERAARTLEADEVRGVIEKYLRDIGKEADIRSVRLDREVTVAPGDAEFTVLPAASSGSPGHMNFDVSVRVPEAPEVRFQGVAQISEWGEVPVAGRSIARGEVLSSTDLTRARVNLTALPRETALDEAQIVGKKLEQPLGAGEIFRRDKLTPPPVVTAGQKVIMVFKSAYFDASATGTALEAGAVGQQVKVRNETSKRVVSGVAVEPGVVQVGSSMLSGGAR